MYGSLNRPGGSSSGGSAEFAPASRPDLVATQLSLPVVDGKYENKEATDSAAPLLPTQTHGASSGSGQATATSCIINLANTIVGAGMLGLPGAFGGTGYLGGTLLIIIGATFSANGLILLAKAAQRAGLPSSFYTVALAAVPQYTILIDLAVALKCFGVATGYLITVGDCMVDALDHLLLNGEPENDESFLVRTLLSRRVWVVGGFLSVLPTSFYKTLDDLKKASALALIFVFFLAAGIIAYAQGVADPCFGYPDTDPCRGDFVPFTDAPSTLSKLPIFVFAFTCHQNIFPVVNEIQLRTQARINFVVITAIGFALFVYLLVAIEGYRTYGSKVRGDILLNYPETTKVTFLRICIAFMLTLHYPLQLDPSRRCITSLVKVVQRWMYRKRHRIYCREDSGFGMENEVTTEETRDHQKEWKREEEKEDNSLFYTITVSFLFLSLLIALCVNDLGIILALVGATGSTLVSYVLPGLIYVKIFPAMDTTKFLAYLQLGTGCMIMPVALYFVIGGKVKE